MFMLTTLNIYIYIYISFNCKQSLEANSKLNSCLADIRRWLININLLCLDLHH